MIAKLREIAHKAQRAPGDHGALTLRYARDHELSGTTRFTVRATGEYELTSNVTMGRQEVSYSGTLDAADRDALLAAINEHGLLDTPPSTRNIGDDEEPVVIGVSYEDLSHELMSWHEDARENPSFHAFETHLLGLIRELSGGKIVSSAD